MSNNGILVTVSQGTLVSHKIEYGGASCLMKQLVRCVILLLFYCCMEDSDGLGNPCSIIFLSL